MSRTSIDHRRPRQEVCAEGMHSALFYRDGDEYMSGIVSFVAPAVAAGEPVAAAVPSQKAKLLREGLAELDVSFELFDMAELGRNPARIIPAVEQMLAAHEGRTLHYIGEPIWPGRSPEEIREATRHEALINLAWPAAQIRVLCPYDARRLPAQVIADAQLTHPTVISEGRARRSPGYAGPAAALGGFDELSPVPPDALDVPFGVDELSALRAVVSDRARRRGMESHRVSDLVLAVSELATNTIRHADGGGLLRVWDLPDRVICEVEDPGHVADPLAGRRVPQAAADGGVGLWAVNQLCDLVEARFGRGGTVVRLHMTLG